jgi:hypothetical protein
VTATAACTAVLGDFTLAPGGGAGSDAGHGNDGSGDEEQETAKVKAIASDVSVYFGRPARLDGSKSTTTAGTLSFVWTVVSTPSGSRVTTNTLMGATSTTPTFQPDVLGVYKLELVVTALGVSNSTLVSLDAILPSVFYASGAAEGDGGTGGTAVYTAVDFDGGFKGGSSHSLMCPTVVTTTIAHEVATFAAFGGRAFDFWEAPAGQPSEFAGFLMDVSDSGTYTSHLYSGTSASSCDAGPNNLGTMNFAVHPYGSEPHFNLDGSRFVVYDSQWNIVTYSFDGETDQTHLVGPYSAQVMPTMAASVLDPSGAQMIASMSDEYFLEPPRVEWTPGGQLAWAVPTPAGWAIMTTPDGRSGATPSTFMTCTGVVPREIAMLLDGSVIASYRQTPTSGENLVHLRPDNTLECVIKTTYTSVGNVSGAIATDFDVSPDGTQIAFLEVDPSSGQDAAAWVVPQGQLPGGYVFTVPVAGGTPMQVSNTPALYGPRWIGAGTSLVFTALNGTADSGAGTVGLATSVVVVQPDGTGETVVAQGDGVTTFVSTSGNAACSTAPGERGAPAAGALLSLAAIAELVRRRGRRR